MPLGGLIILVTVAALLCALLLVVMYLDRNGMLGGGADAVKEETEAGAEAPGTGQDNSIESNTKYADEGASSDIPIPSGKTIDIAALKDKNPDIYAWLYIPEAGIDEPILQDDEYANFYADHNADRKEDENGAVFTQMLNSKDFEDNLTVIYGHNGGNDKGFSNLTVFSDPDYFTKYPYIYIYTGDKVLIYRTFAAYESDDKLIVMFYGTQDDELYRLYLSNIEGYAGLGGRLDKAAWPGPEDKIITLSTGVEGKDDRRYLVQAVLVRTADR